LVDDAAKEIFEKDFKKSVIAIAVVSTVTLGIVIKHYYKNNP